MAKRRMTIDDLWKLRVIGGVSVSPDGERIVFAMKRTDFRANKTYSSLYVVGVKGGRVRRLTRGNHMDVAPKWSADGTHVGFISGRDKARCLWLLPMDGGDPVRLTDRDGDVSVAYVYRPKNERQKLERDGKTDEIARGPQYKHITRLWHKTDGAGFWNGKYAHIYRVGIHGGASKQLTDGAFDDGSPQYSPDGKWLAFLSNRLPNADIEVTNQDIHVLPAGGGRVRKVTPKTGPIVGYSWGPDSKRFAFLGYVGPGRDFIHHHVGAWTVDLTGKRTLCLSGAIDNNCFNVTVGDIAEVTFDGDPPIWSADGSTLHIAVTEQGACRLYTLPTDGRPPRVRVGGDVVIILAQRTAVSGPVAIVIGDALNPGDIHVIVPEDEASVPKRVTNVNRGPLSTVSLSTPEPLHCKRGRHTVHGWVLKPPGFRKGRKYPLILQIHGGPHAQYGHLFYHELQWLAANGYVVVYTNPRGSFGYGLEYCRALYKKWGEPDYPDLMACVDQVIRRGYVDRKRLYVTGGSYGGFMTNWIIGHTDRFRAAVTQRCVSSMDSLAGASDFAWELACAFGGMPWEDPARYRKYSPLTYLPRATTPLLILHSESDLRCPIDQSEQVFTMLKYLGRDVEFVRFEGESHGLSRGGRPRNRAERLRRILDWFERHK
mgnify:CR=1 FL=1